MESNTNFNETCKNCGWRQNVKKKMLENLKIPASLKAQKLLNLIHSFPATYHTLLSPRIGSQIKHRVLYLFIPFRKLKFIKKMSELSKRDRLPTQSEICRFLKKQSTKTIQIIRIVQKTEHTSFPISWDNKKPTDGQQ